MNVLSLPNLLVVAALMGASGVSLLAAGGHGSPLGTTAGQMLLFHAPAVMVAALAIDARHLHETLARVAVAIMIIGVVLFAADLAVRLIGWQRLFPMAAPLGGSLTILSWIILAAAALRAR